MLHSRCCFPCTAVRRDVIKTAEDLESRVALNAILLAEVCLFCAVDFG